MSALTRFLKKRKEKQAANPEPKSKLYQTINNIAIFGSFIAIALFVLGLFKINYHSSINRLPNAFAMAKKLWKRKK